MLTNFFGKSKPITVLVILGLFLSLFIIALTNKISTSNYIETLLLFLLTFAVVIFIDTKNNLSFDNSYAFLVFVLLLGVFPASLNINTFFYCNLTLLLFLRKTYSLQSSKQTYKKLFDSGFWLGISFILEPFSIVFGMLLYIAVYLHKQHSFQKIIIPFVGFFTPLFLFFTYCFWYDTTPLFFNLFDWYTYYDLAIYLQPNYLITIIFLLLFVLASIFIKTPKALAVKNNFRRSWILLLYNFIIAAFFITTIKVKNGSEMLFLLFPSAIIIANLIEVFEHKWFSDALIIILLLFSFSVPFM